MLKKISGLFLGLVVLAGSACVTPTHASSASQVIMTHIQTGSSTSALSEFIALYNMSPSPVDLTDWCLVNKSGVAFVCIGRGNEQGLSRPAISVVLPAHASALVASTGYADELDAPSDAFVATYTAANHSSGALVSSADTLLLVTAQDQVADTWAWTVSPGTGKLFQRVSLLPEPLTYATTGSVSDWRVVSASMVVVPQNQTLEQAAPGQDPDPGPEPGHDPNQTPDPLPTQPGTGLGGDTGDTTGGTTDTTTPPSQPTNQTLADPYLSELMPNPDGSDAGNEYIELCNPNPAATVLLASYSLRIGKDLENSYMFPAGAAITAGQCSAFYNSAIAYTLLNTTSKVQLYKAGAVVGGAVYYESPKSGMAWALIESAWLYTAVGTPGMSNPRAADLTALEDSLAQQEARDAATGVTTSLQPCAANQYRSSVTNRCRLLDTTSGSGTPTACKVGQVRNPATNRCAAVATATVPTPCKDGQERNPATNRCVTSKKMTQADYGVQGAAAQAGSVGVQWYVWLAIVGVVVGLVAYGVWEWRDELRHVLRKARKRFARATQ